MINTVNMSKFYQQTAPPYFYDINKKTINITLNKPILIHTLCLNLQ